MFWKIYFIGLVVFLAIDAIWLGLIAKNFYQKYMGVLMKSNINWLAAFLVYALFIVGLTLFVIMPGLDKKSLINVLVLGGLFGLVAYGVYDLTNLATLKQWTLVVTVVDMLWGMVVGALVSGVTYLLVLKFFL